MDSHLEVVLEDQDDEFESGPRTEGRAWQDLLASPAAPLHCVAHDAGRAAEAWVEVEGHVGSGLDAAAAGQVHLEPGGDTGGISAGSEAETAHLQQQ